LRDRVVRWGGEPDAGGLSEAHQRPNSWPGSHRRGSQAGSRTRPTGRTFSPDPRPPPSFVRAAALDLDPDAVLDGRGRERIIATAVVLGIGRERVGPTTGVKWVRGGVDTRVTSACVGDACASVANAPLRTCVGWVAELVPTAAPRGRARAVNAATRFPLGPSPRSRGTDISAFSAVAWVGAEIGALAGEVGCVGGKVRIGLLVRNLAVATGQGIAAACSEETESEDTQEVKFDVHRKRLRVSTVPTCLGNIRRSPCQCHPDRGTPHRGCFAERQARSGSLAGTKHYSLTAEVG
jgi:hypothetical protein